MENNEYVQSWINFFKLVEDVLTGKTKIWDARYDVRAWVERYYCTNGW